MFYQWFSFKKQSHLLSNLDSFFLTMVLSRHVLSYRIPWCYRTMSQSYLSPWCYRTMASSYLILFLTHPTFVIVPWNIYHTKIYCKWTSLSDRTYRTNLGVRKSKHTWCPDEEGPIQYVYLEAWKPNVVMEQNLMESSFWRPGFFFGALRVWDLKISPDGAFGMYIHCTQAKFLNTPWLPII